MKKNKSIYISLFFITFLLLSASLSACSGSAAIASSWPGLTADENTAYLAFNQHIYAINIINGSEKWHFPVEKNSKISFFASPVLTSDGQLLAGSYHNVLYSLDPASGSENWSFTGADNRYVASPLVTDDMIYAPTAGTHLYALDLKGNLKWTFTADSAFWAQPIAPADCSCIYVPSMDHRIYAIDAQDGSLLWQTDELDGSIVGTPIINDDENLYVGNFASEILQINTKTRQNSTLLSTEGWIWGGPILKDGVLYFGDLSGNLYAYNIAESNMAWSVKPDKAIVGSPLVTDAAVYIGTEAGSLFAYDLQGKPLWSKAYDASIYTTPVIVADQILVALFKSEQLLVALDLDGNELWSFTPAK